MSRRGRTFNQNNPSRFGGMYSDEHDDRDRKSHTTRRVSFKPSGPRGGGAGTSGGVGGGGFKNKMVELAIKTRLEDDEEMFDFIGNRGNYQNDKRGRRRGSPIPRNHPGRKKLIPGNFGWFLVTIPFGQKYEKDLIIRNILNAISPEIFIPRYWKLDKNCVQFYLDDQAIAERILNCDRQIQMPDGFKMQIRVRSGVPSIQIDDQLKERMKLVMAKRYSAQTKALDLSKFHHDPDLKDVFCALFRPTIMLTAIDIIAANIPDLEALNLDDNQIHQLDHLKILNEKLPNLQILHLANNRIPSITALYILRNVPLVELVLSGNPARDRFRQESTYVSEVRKRFPKLIKLDGKTLPMQIVFDVGDQISLPIPKASFLCDLIGADIIRQFLEQYFIIYDSENRQPLLDAYHENAMMSLTVPSGNPSNGRLSNYFEFSRNQIRSQDSEAKYRLLRYGRLKIVSFLSELPKTRHDPQSFSVDLTLFTPKMISFTVAGVFNELSNQRKNDEIRSFQRHFIIVPQGSGFCIRNDALLINTATQIQVKQAFKKQESNQPSTSQSSAVATVQPIATNPTVIIDENTKLQMIQAMSTLSTMNLEWSKKCLEETNWNFEHAKAVFVELQKQNKIPQEAFIK